MSPDEQKVYAQMLNKLEQAYSKLSVSVETDAAPQLNTRRFNPNDIFTWDHYLG